MSKWVLKKSSTYLPKIENNSHFENMRAYFVLRCQNSLSQTTLEMMHLSDVSFQKEILQNCRKLKRKNVFYVVAFDTIKI